MPETRREICVLISHEGQGAWVGALIDGLRAQGHAVTPQLRADRKPAGMLEGRSRIAALRQSGSGALRAAPIALSTSRGHQPAADLIIDLVAVSHDASKAVTPTLLPLLDGHPLWYARAPMTATHAPLITLAMDMGAERHIVASALPAIEDNRRLASRLDAILGRTVDLLLHTVARWARGEGLPPVQVAPAHGASPPLHPLAFEALGFARRAAARAHRILHHGEHWRIGWRRTDRARADAWDLRDFQFLPDDDTGYVADPFPITRDGRTYVFCEHYPRALGKGVIALFELMPDGTPSPLRRVLERPYHLSYPFLLEHEGDVFMLPETGGAGRIELYRAVRFPDEWVLETVLIDGLVAGDATLIPYEGKWWLFAAVAAPGRSSWDALHLYSAPSLFGPWVAHRDNPVVIDARVARPAGAMFVRDGVLWRPAQDCSQVYGGAIHLCEVTRLDASGFSQVVRHRLTPPADWRAARLHTINRIDGLDVIDCDGRLRRR